MHNIVALDEQDIALYEDLCRSNGIVPRLVLITTKQINLLVSLRKNGIKPESSPHWKRVWKIPGKKAQGGKLTQKTAQKFFLSEK